MTNSRRRTGRMVVAVALAVITAVGAAGCSGRVGAVAAPGVSAHRSDAPSVPRPAQMARSTPVRVQIPAIGVDSDLVGLGLKADGTMEVPALGFPAGWYTGAPTPGELGPAIIAGHVDWGGHPGVFYKLRKLAPGDEVTVARADGSVAVFRVTKVQEFPKAHFPTDLVYGNVNRAALRLITCGGSFDRRVHSYDANIVAFAELVAARSRRTGRSTSSPSR